MYQDADKRSASGVLVETLRLSLSPLEPRGAVGPMLGIVVKEDICRAQNPFHPGCRRRDDEGICYEGKNFEASFEDNKYWRQIAKPSLAA
jgi:hypothetical protein